MQAVIAARVEPAQRDAELVSKFPRFPANLNSSVVR